MYLVVVKEWLILLCSHFERSKVRIIKKKKQGQLRTTLYHHELSLKPLLTFLSYFFLCCSSMYIAVWEEEALSYIGRV